LLSSPSLLVSLVSSSDWSDFLVRRFAKLAAEMAEGKPEAEAVLMRDFLSGEMIEPTPTHPKISGLADVGGTAMGSPLIGFDKDAFASYGLPQSANCAMSTETAYAYCGGLNDLIAKHSQRFAGAKVVHWFKERVPDGDDVMLMLHDPSQNEDDEDQEYDARQAQQKARELLTAIEQGERPDLKGNYYYAMTLSGAVGRVMVRDWMEGAFEELVENVQTWFGDLEITTIHGTQSANLPKLEKVVTCVLKPKTKSQKYADWVKQIGSTRVGLWLAAVRNDPIPFHVMKRLVLVTKAFFTSGKLEEVLAEKNDRDYPATLSLLYARMSLMKAYHVRKNREAGAENMSDDMKTHLNEEHPSPAYQCGRLMAVLAGLQRAALGDVGAGVVQRFYAAASSTPSLVLGRLTRTSQFHLNKIESGGLTYWYENKLAEIWGRLGDEVPRTLDLEEQSLFALGYYQQLANLRTKKSDQSEDDTNDTSSEGDDSK